MTIVIRTLFAIAGVLTIGALARASQDAPESKGRRSVGDGVYADGQGDRGQEVYSRVCGACHGPREFAGRIFQMTWSGRSLEAFYTLISTTMPPDRTGRLSDQEYTDVAAYVLRLNGYPAGAMELPADPEVLRQFQFPEKSALSIGASHRRRGWVTEIG